jgi:hypothetical protein
MRSPRPVRAGELGGALALMALAGLAALAVFGPWADGWSALAPFVMVPTAAVAASRYGSHTGAMASFAAAAVGVIATGLGYGPLAALPFPWNLATVQLYLFAMGGLSLTLGATVGAARVGRHEPSPTATDHTDL